MNKQSTKKHAKKKRNQWILMMERKKVIKKVKDKKAVIKTLEINRGNSLKLKTNRR